MANARGAGPGTNTSNNVVATLNAPFGKAAGAARSSGPSANHAPFSKPQDTGGGGIPTQFFDRTMPTAQAGRSGVQANSSLGTIRADR